MNCSNSEYTVVSIRKLGFCFFLSRPEVKVIHDKTEVSGQGAIVYSDLTLKYIYSYIYIY